MKFGKALETNAETMPEGWRPYVIHYKSLKRQINNIVKELDDSGLPSPVIKTLLSQTMAGNMNRVEYSFDEDKQHLKTCIKVVIDDIDLDAVEACAPGPEQLSQEEQLSKLLAHEILFLNNSASSSTSDLDRQNEEGQGQSQTPAAESIRDDRTVSSKESEDLFDSSEGTDSGHKTSPVFVDAISSSAAGADAALTRPDPRPTSAPTHGPDSGTQNSLVAAAIVAAHKTIAPSLLPLPASSPLSPELPSSPEPEPEPLLEQSHETVLTSPPMETLITPGAKREQQSAAAGSGASTPDECHAGAPRIHTTEEDGKKFIVIELSADTAFFDQLGEEISQLSKLQQAYKHEFETKVEDLSKILTVVSSPQNKDMYTWREILKMYLDAQVFVGDQETDRTTRSSEKAQKQLEWFMTEMKRSKLAGKFKQSKSKAAFNSFIQLNSDLIIMKQFRELNQMAMFKILKKHDKRTNLTASSGFPKHLQNEPFYSDNISKSLTYTIGTQLLSIIPQPDDYSCPICMSVAWKPIRLKCSHVFCVRCLIKAQRKNMVNCPVCRQQNSVLEADAGNLDVAMMQYMKLYFPKEIKEKRKESGREQAREEMEALTGQRWTDVPDGSCIIM